MATQLLLDSRLTRAFEVYHVDLADRRGIEFVDKPDFQDVVLFLKQLAATLKILNHRKPDITYLAISQSTIGFIRDSLFLWLAYMFGSKAVIHLHGSNLRNWYEKLHPLLKTYAKASLRRVTRAIVLGESLRRIFYGLVPSDRIVPVPNGLGSSREYPHPRKDQQETLLYKILYLGTLNRLKGVLILLKAIPSVLKARSDVQFVFAGSWSNNEDRMEAEGFISAHELGNRVVFLGHVQGEAKDRLYRSVDLFVFPGVQQEGQPLVVLEAMAAGLPVLFTNRGCLRETVISTHNGLEFQVGDDHDLSGKILWILQHPSEMQRMGRESYKRYKALYTRERFVERMIDVFQDVSGQTSNSSPLYEEK
ncbi:MAG: glycosyltransferase family 4 protein [Syntrophobacteraceae bacterium]